MGAFAVAAIFVADAAWAQTFLTPKSPYQSLSEHHTSYGISQYQSLPTGEKSYPIDVTNPGSVNHIAGLVFYSRSKIDLDTQTGATSYDYTGVPPARYLGCMALRVPVHGAFNIDEGFMEEDVDVTLFSAEGKDEILYVNDGSRLILDNDDDDTRFYVDVVAVPETPVKIGNSNRRMANGLGIVARGAADFESHMHHPNLFTFPEDTADRDDVAKCFCAAADAAGDRFIWQDFGLLCP